jgi:hypothetical protein
MDLENRPNCRWFAPFSVLEGIAHKLYILKCSETEKADGSETKLAFKSPASQVSGAATIVAIFLTPRTMAWNLT